MPTDRSTRSLAPSLRERRRRELVRMISATAVDLFEQNGFSATTIDDIVANAGISRTTFFRYCATKEAAVLVDDAGLESELIRAAEQVSPTRALAELEEVWDSMTDVFDADPAGHDRFLRVRRLMRDNPALRAAGLERDARLTEQIAVALSSREGVTELDAHAVAESFSLGMRLTFDEWVRRTDRSSTSGPPPLKDVYDHVRAALSRANGVASS